MPAAAALFFVRQDLLVLSNVILGLLKCHGELGPVGRRQDPRRAMPHRMDNVWTLGRTQAGHLPTFGTDGRVGSIARCNEQTTCQRRLTVADSLF
jgi:hypothetical protein